MVLANDILTQCSLVLIERFCDSTITSIGPSPGLNTQMTPASVLAVFPGAQLILGSGATQEIITVNSVVGGDIFADIQFAHAPGERLVAATFPSGQPEAPLFTQGEMLKYLADVQNTFLLKTQCICTTTTRNITSGTRFYLLPDDCIRLERVVYKGQELWQTTQADSDMTEDEAEELHSWFYDETPSSNHFGLVEMPQIADTLELWYTQRGPVTLALNTPLIVPDPLAYILKYGVLARAFNKDGDQRDPMKAQYCQKRFDNDTSVVQVLLGETNAAMTDKQTADMV
jgi:hypothetical protein